MKKIILTTAIISALLISCNCCKQKDENDKTAEATENIHDTSASLSNREERNTETHPINNDWVKEIKLDEGNKWEANSETTEGIDKMLDLLKTNDPTTVEDYHYLASKLDEDKVFIVKNCTMEGQSHENLHVFLHPLIEKIGALEKVSTEDKGAEIMASIKENLEGYYNYFQ